MTVNIFSLLGDSLLIILAGFSLVYSFDGSLGQKTRQILRITSLLLLLAIILLSIWTLQHPLLIN
ncbi:hypothetical protein LOB22_01135 [Lactobacillus delbrueckii subsp. lactis]|uniref:Uncharacterized protein n=1 Tax=Lactobacillus leichmannii TaxID=28039 RepID=A0ABT1XXQ6_LACLE|nr:MULTISPECIES: hypothetical protein [Lactobacillus]APG67373.1 hypothetical protein LL035_05295 [Lactobacillus delbrueckii subsp. lactis]MCD5489609.1 hypothetical protein [Lactobacillus delbrueckii subsp. lactis]MCD5495067.1 hypothetical protein [Lactobacillus delbrueckii subsp. lactis]MCD5496820.1 hypothetical protein [Lactobacillus delbrueckii subsp. lactis]MCD5498583.1 hypothetical protein [Lactobacillus delbrueckii subsp. lactis]